MENLTILNPQKLLDFVSESVQNLQLVMQKKFQSRTIIGIYIHICFLVERLVTKTAIEIYENLDDFANNHSDFIEQVNQSFDSMLKNLRAIGARRLKLKLLQLSRARAPVSVAI